MRIGYYPAIGKKHLSCTVHPLNSFSMLPLNSLSKRTRQSLKSPLRHNTRNISEDRTAFLSVLTRKSKVSSCERFSGANFLYLLNASSLSSFTRCLSYRISNFAWSLASLLLSFLSCSSLSLRAFS